LTRDPHQDERVRLGRRRVRVWRRRFPEARRGRESRAGRRL